MKKQNSGAQFVRDFDLKNGIEKPVSLVVREAAKAGHAIVEKTVQNVRAKVRSARAEAMAKRKRRSSSYPTPVVAQAIVEELVPEKGMCALCRRFVDGARRSGVWLPKRGEDHEVLCPNASYPNAPARKSNHESKLLAAGYEIGLSRSIEILESWRNELQSGANA